MIPPGAREIRDPAPEVQRLAGERKRAEDANAHLLSDSIVQVPVPGKPGEHLWVRVVVSAERWHPVQADTGDRMRDAVAASLDGTPWRRAWRRIAALEAEVERLRHPLAAVEPLHLSPEEEERFRRELEEALAHAAGKPPQVVPPVTLFTPEQVRQFLRECVTVVGPDETLVLRVPAAFTPAQVREYQESFDAAREYGTIPFRVLVVIADELGVVAHEEAPPP